MERRTVGPYIEYVQCLGVVDTFDPFVVCLKRNVFVKVEIKVPILLYINVF